MALELRGITAGYGGHTVLRNVNLVVPDQSVVALLGPNGAGKTTLLRVASGLLAPSAGAMLLDGHDVTRWSSDQLARAGVCHVPEGRGVFAALSVRDNLRLQAAPGASPPELGVINRAIGRLTTPSSRESRRPRGATDAIEQASRAFPKLGQRLAQTAGTLSGGEQQMLALAHAYVAESRTVLLDEVSMGLAPKVVDEIFEYLRELASRGRSLLLVEQYVSRALELADYVYVLKKGRIDFAGEPGELGEDAILASYLGESA